MRATRRLFLQGKKFAYALGRTLSRLALIPHPAMSDVEDPGGSRPTRSERNRKCRHRRRRQDAEFRSRAFGFSSDEAMPPLCGRCQVTRHF